MGSNRAAMIVGAGKMGRGFCAEILASAGCHLTFVDSDEARVERLCHAGGYTIYKARKTYFETVTIEGFDALPLSAEGELSDLVAQKGMLIMLAIPFGQLESVAQLLAVCIARKAMETPEEPLDILLCINHIDAKNKLQNYFENMLGGSALDYVHRRVGIVETVAICMCPELPDNLAERDPLGVLTNGYPEMPMDATAFKGEPPRSEKIRLTFHLDAEAHRKMFTFNTAYAAIAYLSAPWHYVWATEAMRNPDIKQGVLDALRESSVGLCGEYGFAQDEMEEWNERILQVIDNPLLGDTINRLGSDTPRKVGPQDRLVGAALLCLKHGGHPDTLARVIACAYRYQVSDDPRTVSFMRFIESEGIETALERYSRLALRNQLHRQVRDIYEKLGDLT